MENIKTEDELEKDESQHFSDNRQSDGKDQEEITNKELDLNVENESQKSQGKEVIEEENIHMTENEEDNHSEGNFSEISLKEEENTIKDKNKIDEEIILKTEKVGIKIPL